MPSTKNNKFLTDKIIVSYEQKEVKIDIYDSSLGKRFLSALKDNLTKKRVLEKNFCFLGWANSKRDLHFLCRELNHNIEDRSIHDR